MEKTAVGSVDSWVPSFSSASAKWQGFSVKQIFNTRDVSPKFLGTILRSRISNGPHFYAIKNLVINMPYPALIPERTGSQMAALFGWQLSLESA